MNKKKKKWLYLPAEIKVREVPAKVLLAAVAASNKDYNVIFARKSDLSRHINAFPPGIVLGFGAHHNFEPEYKKLKDRGFQIFVMDEEALATFSDDMYRRLRVSTGTLKQMDGFLTWGREHSAVLRAAAAPEMPKLYETGNVRFDVLRSEFRRLLRGDIEDIKKRFGRIILVNSSFGAVNHFDGKEKYFESLKKKKVLQDEGDATFYKKYFSLKQDVFEAYCSAIPSIAKNFPDHRIIIRPHPSERYEAWEDSAKDFENVEVIHEGNIHPWILASDAVIHHFCTTALEAFIADVPTIGFRPFKDDNIETPLVYRGSLIAETEEKLIRYLQDVTSGELSELVAIRNRERNALEKYIQNLEGPFAFENMLKAFDEITVPTSKNISIEKLYLRRARTKIGDAYRFVKNGFKFVDVTYTNHKFPSLSKRELESIIDEISQIIALKSINVRKVDEFCYLISKS